MARPKQNPNNPAPQGVLDRQIVLDVQYVGFDQEISYGKIAVHSSVAGDVFKFFNLASRLHFPIARVALSEHGDFAWDDSKIMAANASTGFNYRTIAGSSKPSLHGLGTAFDINPVQNPYMRYEAGVLVQHDGDEWDPEVPGTLHAGHELVLFMEDRGWEWGGHWTPESGRTDYQHFQKLA